MTIDDRLIAAVEVRMHFRSHTVSDLYLGIASLTDHAEPAQAAAAILPLLAELLGRMPDNTVAYAFEVLLEEGLATPRGRQAFDLFCQAARLDVALPAHDRRVQ
jgi:hypothetical protein